MSITTEAVVNVKAVQKSLNQMSRDERVEFIRASGDPKVSVQIAVRDADQPDAPPQPSPVAENILKERIKTFGFRTWSEGGRRRRQRRTPTSRCSGEAKIKKLSMRLEASGVVVTKYTLTSWTVKCVDRATGEEIYFNTTLPKGVGSWASEEEALQGDRREDRRRILARFLPAARATSTGQKVTLSVEGMPDRRGRGPLARELVGLPDVIAVAPRPRRRRRALRPAARRQRPGGRSRRERGAEAAQRQARPGVLQRWARSPATRSRSIFDKRCADASVLSRLRHQSAGRSLRRAAGPAEGVIKDPETLRKLTI